MFYWQQFAAVLLAVMWAYNGWHDVGPVAEEIKDPQRNIPIAYFLGIGIIIALYVGVNLAYHGVLTMREVAEAGIETPQRAMSRFLAPGGSALIRMAHLLMDGIRFYEQCAGVWRTRTCCWGRESRLRWDGTEHSQSSWEGYTVLIGRRIGPSSCRERCRADIWWWPR